MIHAVIQTDHRYHERMVRNKAEKTLFPLVDAMSVQRRRIEQLVLAVFAVLDMEGAGVIGSDQLFELGRMRRHVGQKAAEWTHQQNAKLLAVLDCDANGSVSDEAFADYFGRSLPRAKEPFNEAIAQLMLVDAPSGRAQVGRK